MKTDAKALRRIDKVVISLMALYELVNFLAHRDRTGPTALVDTILTLAVLTLFALIFIGLRPAYLLEGIFHGVLGTINVLWFGADYLFHFVNSPLSNPAFLKPIVVLTIVGNYFLWRYITWNRKPYEPLGMMTTPPGPKPPTLR